MPRQGVFLHPSGPLGRAVLYAYFPSYFRKKNRIIEGLFFIDCTGLLNNVQSSRNRFGLVLQGTSRPELGEGNVFSGNTEQDKVAGGDLPVPTDAPPLP